MWDVVLVVILIVIAISFRIWQSYSSGELSKFVGFMKLASKAENDLFDGKTKSFVIDGGGVEKNVKIKTVNDALNTIMVSSINHDGPKKLYFGPQREKGLHLEYSQKSQHGDDFLTLVEKDGDEVIIESEINLDKMGPVPVADILIDLVERMGTSSTTWWDESSLNED